MKTSLPIFAVAAVAFGALQHESYGQQAIIASNATWQWMHPTNGADPEASDPDFDTTWYTNDGSYNGPAFSSGPGPFAYGGIDYFTSSGITPTNIGTPPTGSRRTAYFKIAFTTTQEFANATIKILADDAAVIYLDGVPLAGGRLNMALASGDSYEYMALQAAQETTVNTVALGTLLAGDHFLAVSVHNADVGSSDLGFFFELYGDPPPPPQILTTRFGGVTTVVRAESTPTGWIHNDAQPGNWRMNSAPAGGPYSVTSLPINLSAVGAANVYVNFFANERSAGSNFETEDGFAALVQLVFDDDSTGSVNLIPAADDLNADGTLTGGSPDEFSPGQTSFANWVPFARVLKGSIPANAKSATLVISGMNNSTSEFFTFSKAMITDENLGGDADGDGQSDYDELVAGTDPSSATSVLRIQTVTYTDTATDADPANDADPDFWTVQWTSVAAHAYSIERSLDGAVWDMWTFGTAPGTLTNVLIEVDDLVAEPPPPAGIFRIRAVP